MTYFLTFFHVVIATILLVTPISAFTTLSSSSTTTTTCLQMVSRDEYLRPHFQVVSTTSVSTGALNILRQRNFGTAATSISTWSSPKASSMEQRVLDHCEEKGGCDLEEMAKLMQDFQTMNHDLAVVNHPHDAGDKAQQQQLDMKSHLQKMHEIATMEEH